MFSKATDKNYVRSCLSDLDFINTNTFNEFKKHIQMTKVTFPLIDVFVECQTRLIKSIHDRQDSESLNQERNVKQLQPVIISYLNHVLEEAPFDEWKSLTASETSTELTVKDLLISIEYLFNIETMGIDTKEKIKIWLNQAAENLKEVGDATTYQELHKIIANIYSEVEANDKKAFAKTIAQAKKIIH